jgi:hypothetical protein
VASAAVPPIESAPVSPTTTDAGSKMPSTSASNDEVVSLDDLPVVDPTGKAKSAAKAKPGPPAPATKPPPATAPAGTPETEWKDRRR